MKVSGSHQVGDARLVGMLLALTYPGWVWVFFALPPILPYRFARHFFGEEWIPEGGSFRVIAAALPPALVIIGLASAVVLARRPWLMKTAAVVSGFQVVALLWATRDEITMLPNATSALVVILIALAVVWRASVWHRASDA
jgi:hypothetical protein